MVAHSTGWTFTRVKNAIFDSGLKPNERLAYVVLSYFADNDGACFPSYASIAEKMGCSRPTAINAVDSLVSKGWVSKKERSEDGEQTSNIYVIHEGVVKNFNWGGKESLLGVVKNLYPNESHLNENHLTIQQDAFTEVLEYTNTTLGRRFKPDNPDHRAAITAALKSYSVDDLKVLVDWVKATWTTESLRKAWFPRSIFGGDKLDSKIQYAADFAAKRVAPKLRSVYDLMREDEHES